MFCKSDMPTKTISSDDPDFHLLADGKSYVRLFDSIPKFAEEWDAVAPKNNVFLQRPFLTAVEDNPPEGMQFRYLLFYENEQPFGLAVCQILYFRADESLTWEEEKKPAGFFWNVAKRLRGQLARKVEFNTLICGNLLLTGEHGYYFDPRYANGEETVFLVSEAINYLLQQLQLDGVKISVHLLKDYYSSGDPIVNSFVEYGFNEVKVQPNMVMELRPEWRSFKDYLNALQSKYRVRARRAFKKAQGIKRKEFSFQDIEDNNQTINELYQQVASGVEFNVVKLDPNYWLGLKQQLREGFQLTGYYSGDRLIGFYTTIKNGDELEAHFLGIDKDCNRDFQIYLNMLFDMVRRGIEKGVHRIIFARTAMEIKSSVGAKAEEMYCYLRHRNNISNVLAAPILNFLQPRVSWTPRHPFKAE